MIGLFYWLQYKTKQLLFRRWDVQVRKIMTDKLFDEAEEPGPPDHQAETITKRALMKRHESEQIPSTNALSRPELKKHAELKRMSSYRKVDLHKDYCCEFLKQTLAVES